MKKLSQQKALAVLAEVHKRLKDNRKDTASDQVNDLHHTLAFEIRENLNRDPKLSESDLTETMLNSILKMVERSLLTYTINNARTMSRERFKLSELEEKLDEQARLCNVLEVFKENC